MSPSVATAVIPTESPCDAASETSFEALSESVGAWTGISFVSVIVTVKVALSVLPSSLVALAVRVHVDAVSKSTAVVSATVTMPEEASTAKAPAQDWLVMSYAMPLFDPSASDAETVICTSVPFAALSAISLASESESTGVDTSCSFTSVTLMLMVWSAVFPAVSEARMTTSQGLALHVMDSKSCPDASVNVNAPVVPSIENNAESVPPKTM